ncbi:MAG: DUF4153 domain-containing protein [Pseudomonadota bacterium]
MTDTVTPQSDRPDWRNRTLILALVGAIAAWLVWWIMDMSAPYIDRAFDPSILARRAALATGIAVAAIAFGFGLERIRIRWTVGFALVLGLVAGLILWWNNDGHGIWNWSGASLFLAIALAVPLFQVARDEGRLSFPYSQIHGHAWTNVVLWFACWAFAGISMLLTVLMAELFKLIGITFLHDLLEKGWFPALVIGGAFGAALGLFRDRDTVVRLLQRVVTGVLSVLAPILGAGLLIFLLSLPFTGLHTLWEATRNTTPILLTCVIGALILTNAVLGHGPEDEATNPILRGGAMALGVAMLPLAIVAAIATGLRIQQYGFTPDRLWALVFVILTTAYGMVYFVALIRKRQNWAVQVRPDNIRLAFATLALALLMATPLVGFNAISTNSQVARLTSGKVSVDKFDWAALAFDFGEPGRRALASLSRSANSAIAAKAKGTQKADSRWDIAGVDTMGDGAAALAKRVRILPHAVALPEGLLLSFQTGATDTGTAVLWYEPGASSAVLVSSNCDKCAPQVSLARRDAKGEWQQDRNAADLGRSRGVEENKALSDLLAKQGFQLRPVQRRQVFIGDQPVGDPFE